jgi:gamma-glutamylcyclotransferase (GGCT)/AIG2-like uncharacterized protein YtfP
MKTAEALLKLPVIKIFVYGTLKKGQRLGFYLNGAKFLGNFYTEGQLMKAQNGSVYIDFAYSNVVTIGEVYYVDFYCLQRINHLEVFSGVFPQGYDLNVLPIWRYEEGKSYSFLKDNSQWAFFYKRKNNPVKILTGNYCDDFEPIDALENILMGSVDKVEPDCIIEEMRKRLSIYESYSF